MKSDPRWHYIGALALAGVLSLYASFLGLMGFAWGGVPHRGFPATFFLVVIAPLLAFPLYLLAVASSKIASFTMWALGPAYSLALFQISAGQYIGSLPHYLGLLLACFVDRIAIVLWVAAWLVHFGARIYPPVAKEPAPMIGS